MIDRYRWAGGEEHMLRYGVTSNVQIILVQPFFEEANRVRHLLVNIMRALEAEGIGTILPDLPGTGESLTPLQDVTLANWRDALGDAAARFGEATLLCASFRGGALIDDAVPAIAHWRCVPDTGQRLVRDLMRTRLTGAHEVKATDHVMLAGNRIGHVMLDALATTIPVPHPRLRTVRLETDANDADARVAGTPLWRRSEPGDDPVLEAALISDLTHWARQCDKS